MYDILQLVMDFQKSPSKYGDLTDPAKPLPDDIDLLLEVAAGEVESSTINDDVAMKQSISQELVSAAMYFIEHALFIPKGNHYRTLGVEGDADEEQIRKHFHLLLKILQLDREDKSDEWNTSYAMRINHAYSILRDPVKRRNYDQILNKQGIRVVGGENGFHHGADNPELSASDTKRAALADLLTTYQEKHHDRPVPAKASRPRTNEPPKPATSNVSFIAGNINRANNVGNGQGKAAAVTTSEVNVEEPKKEARKQPFQQTLTSEELDSFEQLIRTQPTQHSKLFELAKNNSDRYRSITVLLSILLLVVAVIYVMQEISDDAEVQPNVAQVNQPVDTAKDGDGTTEPPESTLSAEEPPTMLMTEEAAKHEDQLLESQPPLVETPSAKNVEQQTIRSSRSQIRKQRKIQQVILRRWLKSLLKNHPGKKPHRLQKKQLKKLQCPWQPRKHPRQNPR